MKVTTRRIKMRAAYETIRLLPTLLYQFTVDIKLAYYRFHNAMCEAYIRNPNIPWKRE